MHIPKNNVPTTGNMQETTPRIPNEVCFVIDPLKLGQDLL